MSVVYADSTLTFPGEINKSEVIDAMKSSLSGIPDDYTWQYEPRESTFSIIAHASYQDRFKEKKTQYEILEEKFQKMVNADEYANNVIKRSQTYTRMGRGRIFTSR